MQYLPHKTDRYDSTVQPRLSEPRLSVSSIIRTCSSSMAALVRMLSGCGKDCWGCGKRLIKVPRTSTSFSGQKLTDLCTCMNAVDSDYAIQISSKTLAP